MLFKIKSHASNCGVAGLSGNAAVVVIVTGHEDIALLPPGLSPAVLNNVVILSILCAIANSQHTVVQRGRRAEGVRVDTLFVVVEGGFAGINGDRYWANTGYGLGQCLFVSLRDINIARVCGTNILFFESAELIVSLVWIALFGIYSTVGLDVPESVVHETAFATVVTIFGGAIDKVLFT